MAIKRHIKLGLACLVLALFLAGCVPAEFKSPLSGDEPARADLRPEGVWVKKTFDAAGTEKYGKEFIHFFPAGDDSLEMVLVNHDAKTALRAGVSCAVLDNENYMNLRHRYYKHEEGTYDFAQMDTSEYYWLAKYELKGDDRLSIWYVDMDTAEKLIEKGKAEGRIIKNRENETARVVLDYDSEALRKMVEGTDHGELFKAYGYYERVGFGGK